MACVRHHKWIEHERTFQPIEDQILQLHLLVRENTLQGIKNKRIRISARISVRISARISTRISTRIRARISASLLRV